MRMQGYTQSDIEEFDRTANEKEELRSHSKGKALLKRPIQGRTTHQGGGSDTTKTKEHPEYNQLAQWNMEKHGQTILRPLS